MLFRLLAVSIVAITLVSKAYGLNCTAVIEAMNDCFSKSANKAASATFSFQMFFSNTKGAIQTCTKLKNKGCFKTPASLFNDLKTYINLNIAPAPLAKIYKAVKKADKTAIQNIFKKPTDQKIAEKAQAVLVAMNEKIGKLKEADMQKIIDWNHAYYDACGWDYPEYSSYSSYSGSGGSSSYYDY